MNLNLKFTDEAAAKAVLYSKARPAGYVFETKEVDVWVYQTAYNEHVFYMEYTPEECADYGYTFVRKDKKTVSVDPNPNSDDWEFSPNYRNIDTIGVIYKGGAWDAEGNQITAPVALEGWHVNVFVLPDEDGSVLEAHQVFPATPVRVWA